MEECRALLANSHLLVNVVDKLSSNNTQGSLYSLKEAYFVLEKDIVACVATPLFEI